MTASKWLGMYRAAVKELVRADRANQQAWERLHHLASNAPSLATYERGHAVLDAALAALRKETQ